MGRLLRTERAVQDYREIWRYIARDNPSAADRLLRRFDEKLQLYADHPEMGTVRRHYGQSLRSFPVGNYVLFYEPISGGIQLVRALHGARNFPREFRRPS
jgi:toxin ParE1/3/4